MTIETSDPTVAALYGALAYPSQRPALETAVHLVAGQPGPWLLEDDDRAGLAAHLHARLSHHAEPADATTPSPVAPAGTVMDACKAARVALFNFWTAHHATLPAHLEHEVTQLETALAKFITERDREISDDGKPVRNMPAPISPWPTAADATDYRLDQWVVLIRDRQLRPPAILRALRARVEAAGLVPPSSLRDVEGQRWLAEHLLAVISDQYQAANP